MTSAQSPIVISIHDKVAVLTINRPSVGNALRSQDVRCLHAETAIHLADPRVRAIVLTGATGKFFCAGADVAELATGISNVDAHIAAWHDLTDLLESGNKPIIAAINGLAVGGGLELALACHFRLAAESARVGLPELKVGLFPASGGLRRLAGIVGLSRTIDFVFTAELVSANAALDLGIVDKVLADKDFEAGVAALGSRYTRFEPNAVAAVLRCARAPAHGRSGNTLERKLFQVCYSTQRNQEILRGFLATARK